jgi:hypothetical protein
LFSFNIFWQIGGINMRSLLFILFSSLCIAAGTTYSIVDVHPFFSSLSNGFLWLKSLIMYCSLSIYLFLAFSLFVRMSHSKHVENTSKKPSPALRLVFLLASNAIFFVVFNFGYIAAAHLYGSFARNGFVNIGLYFFVIVILVFSVFAMNILSKSLAVDWKGLILHTIGLLSILIFSVSMSTLPNFNLVPPFLFNISFSFVYSTFLGTIDVLYLLQEPPDR